LQCGGSDAFSGVTANPALGYAADLLVRAGATVMFSKNPSYEFVRKPKTPGAPNVHVQGPIGMDGYYRFQNAPDGTVTGFKGTWMNDRTLLVSNRVLGDDTTTEFIFRTSASSVNLEIKGRRGFKLEIKGSIGETAK
jgi:hypothetical protein